MRIPHPLIRMSQQRSSTIAETQLHVRYSVLIMSIFVFILTLTDLGGYVSSKKSCRSFIIFRYLSLTSWYSSLSLLCIEKDYVSGRAQHERETLTVMTYLAGDSVESLEVSTSISFFVSASRTSWCSCKICCCLGSLSFVSLCSCPLI
jgi:hypothetical protein